MLLTKKKKGIIIFTEAPQRSCRNRTSQKGGREGGGGGGGGIPPYIQEPKYSTVRVAHNFAIPSASIDHLQCLSCHATSFKSVRKIPLSSYKLDKYSFSPSTHRYKLSDNCVGIG